MFETTGIDVTRHAESIYGGLSSWGAQPRKNPNQEPPLCHALSRMCHATPKLNLVVEGLRLNSVVEILKLNLVEEILRLNLVVDVLSRNP